MKFWQRVVLSLVLALIGTSGAAMASPEFTFSFNQYLGNVWVGEVTIQSGDTTPFYVCVERDTECVSWDWQYQQGLRMETEIGLPTCSSPATLEGGVTFSWSNNEGASFTESFNLNGERERTTIRLSHELLGNYGRPDGHMYVRAWSRCNPA